MRVAALVGAALALWPAASQAGPLQLAVTGSIPTGVVGRDLALADVTGDGVLDLLVAQNDGVLAVRAGDGAGGFGAPTPTPVGPGGPPLDAIAVGNLNGDALPDAVLVNTGNGVYRLLGQPGGLGPAVPVVLGMQPASVAIGDLDNDTLPDVAVADANAAGNQVYWGDGAGGFPASSPLTGVSGLSTGDVALADVTGDGRLDVHTIAEGASGAYVVRNTGSRTFAMAGLLPGGYAGWTIALGDVTGDGVLDRVTAGASSFAVQVAAGTGNGGYAVPTAIDLDDFTTDAELGDLDGDGVLDLAVTTFQGAMNGRSRVHVLRGAGGALVPAGTYDVGEEPMAVSIGDLDRDGRPDVVSLNQAARTATVLRNTTLFPAPGVVTGGAASVAHDSARVGGSVEPRGRAAAVRVEYGTTSGYGSATADVAVGSGGGAVPVTLDVGGLAPSTTYHYRLVATSPVGETAVGADATLTTAPPPPAATLDSAALKARWKRSRLTGTVTVKGTVNGPARLVATLVRAGKSAAVRRVTFANVPAGAFSRRLTLPTLLAPGRYAIDLRATVSGAVLPSARRFVTLPAPREGVVRRAWASALRSTSPLLNLPGTPRQLWAHFEFLTPPKKRPITTTWYRGTRVVAVVARPFERVIHTFVRSDRPLRPGRWRAVMKAGGTVVAEVRVRVG